MYDARVPCLQRRLDACNDTDRDNSAGRAVKISESDVPTANSSKRTFLFLRLPFPTPSGNKSIDGTSFPLDATSEATFFFFLFFLFIILLAEVVEDGLTSIMSNCNFLFLI